jgi:two-component sensor histidine kinase/PAS domain-containing protein
MIGTHKTILLVEDEAIIALNESRRLAAIGYSVVHALNGRQAVDLFRRSPDSFDLVLMDIDLGEGIDGTEAARIILEAHDVPVLFLSSHTEPEVVERTERITSYGYVVKASDFAVLDASIKMAFKLFEAQKRLSQKNMEIEAVNERLRASVEELQVTSEELEAANTSLIQSERDMLDHERKLTESEASLTKAESVAGFGNWQYHLESGTFTGSKGASDIYGLSSSQWTLSEILRIPLPEYRPALDAAMKGLVERGEPYDIDFKIRQIGTGAILDIRSIAEYDEKRRTVFGVMHDVTRERKAEETARREQLFLRTLIDILPDAVYFKDLSGRKTISNIAAYRDMDRTPENDELDKTDLELFPGEVGMRGYLDDQKVFGGTPIIDREEDFVDSEGRVKWLLTSKVPLRNAQGRIIGLVGVGRDITEQKKLEESLRRTVEEKNVLMKELEHRIKNNLGVVSSLLSLELEALRDEKAKDIFRAAIGRIDSISSAYERLYLSEDLAQVDMRGYIEGLASSITRTTDVGGEFLRMRLDLIDLQLDAAHAVPLGLILHEAILNAVKHAYPPMTEGEIRVSLASANGIVSLSVADDGVGMPRCFDPAAGTGMTLISMLAKQLGGEAKIESEKGTKISVSFALRT